MILKHLFSADLKHFQNFSTIDFICTYCYRETGNKFWIAFHGSKGYLSNIEISCEGIQKFDTNRIFVENYRNKDRSFKKKYVSIYYSDECGVVITLNKEKPKIEGKEFTLDSNKRDLIEKPENFN
ncbi:MAG TPA: hypothetical protein P5084_00595 [Paludibacter sp.]|nr:hypothetical protein [Paludibacter sp.]